MRLGRVVAAGTAAGSVVGGYVLTVRGAVPYVRETFQLDGVNGGTEFVYSGELGADLWAVGRWWAGRVARSWERAVEGSMAGIKTEAERRAAAPNSRNSAGL